MEASLLAVIVGSLLAAGDSAFAGENVALTGQATQSSVYPGTVGYLGLAINAIDGNKNANYAHGSCTHTDREYSPWWRVNLIKPHKIHSIAITGRAAVPERLKGAEIRIGSSLENEGKNNPRCGYISSIGPSETLTFQCHGMVGNVVNIVMPGRYEWLTLCEVEVFGELEYEHMG